MLCCVCKQNEATVHLTQIANDKVQKVDLCEGCAKEKGVNDPTGFSLADLLLGLGSGAELAPATPAGENLACPRCGFTQADFKKTGRLGCAECYETFKEGLSGLLKSMHKGTRHVGKTPAGAPPPPPPPPSKRAAKAEAAGPGAAKAELQQQLKLQMLQAKLAQAIKAEDFEQAAKFRDEIKAFNASLTPPATA
jgi:protein arginine kinase activator